jgi:hypothetical protein
LFFVERLARQIRIQPRPIPKEVKAQILVS